MSKVILFEKSYYKGYYYSFNIDENISEDYVLLYEHPSFLTEINSIINVYIDFYVTLVYAENEYYINIENDIADIKSSVKGSEFPIVTKFNKIYLIRRSLNPTSFNEVRGEIFSIPPGSPFADYTQNYTYQGEETFIQEHIQQQACLASVEYEECKKNTNQLQIDYDALETKLSECESKLNSIPQQKSEYEKIEKDLNTKIKELRTENKKLTETKSISEYVLVVLILLGVVMFVYCVYISWYRPL